MANRLTMMFRKAGSSIVVKPISQVTRFGQQLFQAPQDNIRGIKPEAWYSPLQPVQPMAPEGTEPRAFQYWAGQNLLWTPRADAELSAADLKTLAQYPLARICIENVKDSIGRIPWEVQLKRQPGETKKQAQVRAKGNAELVKLNRFFEQPDREHNWTEWIRPLLDDMLVIDAASILVRKTFKGEVVELPVLRGDSIVRYIDEQGYTPVPPSPAYAQIWWGIPLCDLTTDQLVYRPRSIVPRNTVSSQMYGMSPTEQLASEIEIGIKRLEFVLSYYTNGSIPDVVQVVPKGVPADKIAEAMQWMNSELAGNLAARRQWRYVQGFADKESGGKDEIYFTKEKLLADAFDELHIRKVCFGYGTSPQRLMRMVGTRNAGEQQEAAELEGLIPWVIWLKGVRDYITQRVFGYADFENVFDAAREPDPEKMAASLKVLVSSAIKTPNEAREELGEEPNDADEADQLGVITANGFTPLGADDQLAQQQTLGTDPESQHKRNVEVQNAKPDIAKPNGKPADAVGKPNGKANGSGHAAPERGHYGFASVLDAQNDLQRGYAEVIKTEAHQIVKPKIDPAALTPQSQLAKRRFEVTVHNAFALMFNLTVGVLNRKVKLVKTQSEDATVKAILKKLVTEWEALPDAVEDDYLRAALGGTSLGVLQVSVTDADMLAKINYTASDWARRRAAELVGMRRTKNGELVSNPNAKWAVTDSTRDQLNIVVRDLFAEESPTLSEIEARVAQAGIFSDTRASMIARTEVSLAQTQGNLEAWRASNKVKTVEWQLSSNHDRDDECDGNAAGSPYTMDDVPDLPAHPNCDCVLVLGELVGEEA